VAEGIEGAQQPEATDRRALPGGWTRGTITKVCWHVDLRVGDAAEQFAGSLPSFSESCSVSTWSGTSDCSWVALSG